MEYDLPDQRDALDYGVSGDESSCSDASFNYEELAKPEFMVQVVEVEVGDEREDEGEEEDASYDEADIGSANEAEGIMRMVKMEFLTMKES
jgi:hypothetical protein